MQKFSVFVAISFIFLVIGIFWWRNGLSAVNPSDKSTKLFVIPKGQPVKSIGNELKAEGFIKDSVVFFLYARLNNLDRQIQAGSYKLSPSMPLVKIIDTFRHGSVDVWVTIPEGLRAEEIALILKENLPSYNDSWEEILKENEGYLFPDTYLIPKDAEVQTVISILNTNLSQKLKTIGLTLDDPRLSRLITIASLIEREAKFDEDKSYVASVINNRLEIGMALQIDATAQYAYGYNKRDKTWWRVPSSEDVKINSPYNTYVINGLPPGPICNPGIGAIEAALNPKTTDFIFYVNDDKGKLHFAENLQKHNQNIEKYLN